MALFSSIWWLILVLIIFMYLWNRRKYYWLSLRIPTIFGLPFVGVALKIRKQENVLKFINETRKNFPPEPILVWTGPLPVIYVGDPDSLRTFFLSNNFIDKADFYQFVGDHIGPRPGLFTSKTPLYNIHRKLIDPSFNIQLLKNFVPIFNEQGNILSEKLKQYADDKTEFDMLPLLELCTLDISCLTTMGKYMNFQGNQNIELAQSYSNLLKFASTRIFNPLYHFDFIFNWSKWGKSLLRSKQLTQKFMNQLLEDKMSKWTSENNEANQRKPETDDDNVKSHNIFIDRALEYYRNNQFTFDDVKSESNTLVLAAYETSANTVAFTLACLAMYPEYQEKLYDELCSVFPEKNFVMTPEDLMNRLPYLEMVVNENLRLMAPIPLVGRTCIEEFQLKDGITLPKGTQIILDIFNMQRDEQYWGSNAKKYDPEHFSTENLENVHPFAFVPFAKGYRACLGNKYALMSVKTMVAKFVRKYRFETDFKLKDFQFVEDVSLKLVKYPHFKIFERSK